MIKKLVVDLLFVLIELFRQVLRLRRYERISIGSLCFRRGGSFSVEFSRGRGRPPSTIFARINNNESV